MDASALAEADDLIGRMNDEYILAAVREGTRRVNGVELQPVCGTSDGRRTRNVPRGGCALESWGTTKDGDPRHPLYLRSSIPLQLQPWIRTRPLTAQRREASNKRGAAGGGRCRIAKTVQHRCPAKTNSDFLGRSTKVYHRSIKSRFHDLADGS